MVSEHEPKPILLEAVPWRNGKEIKLCPQLLSEGGTPQLIVDAEDAESIGFDKFIESFTSTLKKHREHVKSKPSHPKQKTTGIINEQVQMLGDWPDRYNFPARIYFPNGINGTIKQSTMKLRFLEPSDKENLIHLIDTFNDHTDLKNV